MSRAVGRTMIENGFGRIITIASRAGSVPIEQHAAHCSAKSGLIGLRMREQIPTGRFAEPEEIAAAAMFLASDDAAMIDGADLVVDDGFTIH